MKTWIFSQKIDILGLFLPVWLCWLVCFWLPDTMLQQNLPLWVWVVVVMCIDVSHVWSTIFRTYLDKEEFLQHKKLLLRTPILVFLGLFLLAFFSILWFWRVMAYLALHHFIKQQYGFLMLYKIKNSKNEQNQAENQENKIIQNNFLQFFTDQRVLYFSMLYPVFFWHFAQKRDFQWFYMGDFFQFLGNFPVIFPQNIVDSVWLFLHICYVGVILLWLCKELYFSKNKKIPWGKILWVLTTATNWFLGIVYFNADITFTLTNVVAHGIPYIILLFFYVEKKKEVKNKNLKKLKNTYIKFFFHTKNIILMLFLALLLAFLEEYCWDWLINRQKTQFFTYFLQYPSDLLTNPYIKAIFFALLAMPQVAHYIIDGYIWKNNHQNPYIKAVLFDK